uniref:Uncharacterized protein n=1 Tax=Arundo donax TaxID=35708 RepID=A0A0A8YQ44_ARUDO
MMGYYIYCTFYSFKR